MDNPAEPDSGGERHVYYYSPSSNGDKICEQKSFTLPCNLDSEEHLFKKTIEVKDSTSRTIEYAEYDIDELCYSEQFIYDTRGNIVENLCEYYEEGYLKRGIIVKSIYDSVGREIYRVITEPKVSLYKQYKEKVGVIKGDDIERYTFEYDKDSYIKKKNVISLLEKSMSTHISMMKGIDSLRRTQ